MPLFIWKKDCHKCYFGIEWVSLCQGGPGWYIGVVWDYQIISWWLQGARRAVAQRRAVLRLSIMTVVQKTTTEPGIGCLGTRDPWPLAKPRHKPGRTLLFLLSFFLSFLLFFNALFHSFFLFGFQTKQFSSWFHCKTLSSKHVFQSGQ